MPSPSSERDSSPRRFASAALLIVCYGLGAVATAVSSIAIGRFLGAAALGVYSFAVSTSRIAHAGLELGLNTHFTRLVARDRGQAEARGSLFVTARALMVPVVVGATTLAAVLTDMHDLLAVALLALGVGLTAIASLYEALFIAHDDFGSVTRLNILAAFLLLLGTIAWVVLGRDLVLCTSLYLASAAAALGAWVGRARARYGFRVRATWQPARLLAELRRSAPIGVSVVLGLAALKCPVIVLASFSNSTVVGRYAAVEMFITGAGLIQVAITNVSFPMLSQAFGKDPAAYRRVFWLSNGVLAGAGVLIALFLSAWGDPLVHLIYRGRDFAGLDNLIPVMAWSIPFLLLAHHNVYVFAAANRQGRNSLLMLVWFLAVGTLQVVLVPRYGLAGAAWGLLIGRAIGFGGVAIAGYIDAVHVGTRRTTAATP